MRRIFLYVCPLLFFPVIALAAAPRTFQELVNTLVIIIDNAAIVLVVLGIVIYFYGTTTKLFKMKHGSSEGLGPYLMIGIGILFVMVSIWGILQLLQYTLFGNDALNPTTGTTGSAPSGVFIPPQFNE